MVARDRPPDDGSIDPHPASESQNMPAIATVIGILLIIVAIPFGLMLGPLALGIVIAVLGWRHVAAGWQQQSEGISA